MTDEIRARQAGARGFHAGKAYSDNPYGEYLLEKNLKLAWSQGYNDAKVMTLLHQVEMRD